MAARRTVQVRAYADRIVVRCGEEVVAEHARFFGRNRTLYDPWHYRKRRLFPTLSLAV